MSELTVANTILGQIGGINKLSVMIGAHSFYGEKNSLTFKYKAKSEVGNCIKIELDPSDTYNVYFISIRNTKAGTVIKEMGKSEGIYCEDLKRVISEKTGLVLTMPKIIFK